MILDATDTKTTERNNRHTKQTRTDRDESETRPTNRCVEINTFIYKRQETNNNQGTPFSRRPRLLLTDVPCFRRDVLSLGVTSLEHQKLILTSIQALRAQVIQMHGRGVQV